MQKKLTLESGHALVINHVPASAAFNLKRVCARECIKVGVKFSEGLIPALLMEPEGATQEEKAARRRLNVIAALSGTDVDTIKNLFLQLIGSEEVDEAILTCASKWMLDGKAVSFESFEPDDFRGDYYPVAVEVAKEALVPLFRSLGSLLPTQSEPRESASQK